MRVAAGAEKGGVGAEGEVAGDFLPDIVEVVEGPPHVFAASAEGVRAGGAVIIGGAGVEHGAHVLLALEDSERRGRARCRSGLGVQRGHGDKRAQCEGAQLNQGRQRFLRHRRPFEIRLRLLWIDLQEVAARQRRLNPGCRSNSNSPTGQKDISSWTDKPDLAFGASSLGRESPNC